MARPESPSVPATADLESWLAAREAGHGDIREDADARIVWAGAAGVRTPLSLVYLHGFSASRMETSPLCDLVARACGANLFYARLAGHGRTPAAMGAATREDWIEDGRLAFEIGSRLGERVVLVGTSTGGTLATLLAAQAPAALAALVLLAPNFGPRDPRAGLLAWPGARTWVPWVVGATREVEPESEGHARHWMTTYPSTALVAMMQLVRATERSALERIRVPVLAMFSDDDQVVDARRTRPMLARMAAARVEIEPVTAVADAPVANPSGHVFAGDVFAPHATEPTAERILRFLATHGLTDGATPSPQTES
ncbi:MAG TPA: alpha/beta fold hydrolase [Pseudomonadales bacterium]|nr:alpha/beta fold hydrolase [Pseudomonadales bacterium]